MTSELNATPALNKDISSTSDYPGTGAYTFVVVINSRSGTGTADAILERLSQYSSHIRIARKVVLNNTGDIEQKIAKIFRFATKNNFAVLAAGGDGTINLCVKYALKSNVPIATLAQGTFNLFARHHGLSEDPDKQIEQLATCRLQEVPVCWMNEIPFTTSAAFGIYPAVINDREHYQKKAGFRSRSTAILAGILTFFRHKKRLNVFLETEDGSKRIKALLVMATQNRPQLQNFNCEDILGEIDGRFALVVITPLGWQAKVRLFLKGSIGKLPQQDEFSVALHQTITIHSTKKTLKCALDGEIIEAKLPVHIHVQPQALNLFLPPNKTNQD